MGRVLARRGPGVSVACLAIALAFAAVAGLKAATAAELSFTVTSTADAVDANVGDGLCATSSGACTLRAAIQETNARPGADVVFVPGGTYALAIPGVNQNDVTTGDLDITDSLTLSGAGASSTTVDGGTPPAGSPPDRRGLDRLFEVQADGAAVTFSGLTLSDGYAAEYGGAIMNNSTAAITVDSATLTGNVAGKTGGAIDNHVGGAVDVRNSTLSGNYAGESGSALNNNRGGAVTLTDVMVSGNSATVVGLDPELRGAGAIANNAELDAQGSITVLDSRFSDNRAGGGHSGAAISNDGGGIVSVDRTEFSKNDSHADAGAIFNGTGEVTVTDSTFSENSAEDGGAIASTGGAVTVLDSTFSKNSGQGLGGAMRNGNLGAVTIRNSTFSENTALGGGGFSNEGTGLVTVESTTFTKNAAIVTALLASGEGGGMHSNSGGEVVIAGGSFTDNRARGGGGLTNEGGGHVTITGTRFSANHADEQGGGILVQGGAVRMVNIDVVGNVSSSAEEGGGGISYHGDKSMADGESAAIESSRVRDNKSGGQGGGIDSRGDGPLLITTTTITGNTAAIGGAIHHVGDAPLAVTRSTLSGNSADNAGGVFVDGDGESTLENTTVSGNRAGQFGGGLLASSRLTVRNSTVTANLAASGGGIGNGGGELGDGFVFVANTIVAGNPAGGNCVGTIISRGGNVENSNTCQLTQTSDQPGTNPGLGPLADNGGPTQTHALLAGSLAQESAACTELDPCPPVDQRGVVRPQFEGVDSGAYESELTPGGGTQQCVGLTERPVPADYDSWVSQSSPTTNFGTGAILDVASQSGGNKRALVHFTLPPIPPGCKLVGATLRLHSASATDGRTLQALRVTSAWSELGVTWANQPATAGAPATTPSGLGVRVWNVLEQARDLYALGGQGFLIRDAAENGSGAQSFHSREKGLEGAPELVLVFDDPDSPPLPGSCPKVAQFFSADRDSWVSQASASDNFGSDSALKVKSQSGSNSRALVRFALPLLPAGCTTIASATLQLEAASAKEGRTLEVHQVAGPWTETGVTWSNQPSTTGPAVTTPSAQGPLEWTVTSQVLGMYTSANHGFLVRDAAENGVGDEQTLNSRDKLDDGPPQLVLAFDDSTPETTLDPGPVSPTESTDASFTFSSDREDAAFECSLDGAAFAACTSPNSSEGLAEGAHSFSVRATRRVRAVDPTPAAHGWTVAIPPETSVAGPDSPSASTRAELTFSSDDTEATFECSLNGADFAACTSPAEYTGLGDGRQEVRVRAIDPLGNADPTPAAHVWTVAVPPETAIDDRPADPSNDSSPSFAFSGSDNGTAASELVFACRLDAGDWIACAGPQGYEEVADGAHTFEVRATDLAGNTDPEPASYSWTVDTTAPQTQIDLHPSDPSNDPSPWFEFSSSEEGSTFECRLGEDEWAVCTSPQDYGPLADGAYRFQVRATDRAGNTDDVPSGYGWTVDTVAPETTVDAAPADPSNDASPAFGFGANEDASFECKLDDGFWAACTSPQEYEALADGPHSFRVRATDKAGNPEAEPAGYGWTIDTLAPTTTIDAGPPDPSNDDSPSFEFSSSEEGSTFACRLDEGEWLSCSSPQAYGPLADGEHTFQVRAIDRAGNPDAGAAARTWSIDTVAPQTSIDAHPRDPSNDDSPSFEFSSSEEGSSFACRLGEGEWVSCSSPQAYGPLADGAYSFQVRATDAAGNTDSLASGFSWTVDTVAPETAVDSGPPDPTRSTSASLEFSSEDGAGFECRLDEGDWVACFSPQGYDGLADGGHTFEVRATDRAGNTDGSPAGHTWTVDTVAPQTSIDAHPADPSNDVSPSFEFSSSEEGSTFECRLGEGEWLSCSSPQAYGPLADGAYRFQVRATDRAGNTDPLAAGFSWTVDTVAPETTIQSGPADPTRSTSASFVFSADEEGSTFECRLDEGDWASCSIPQAYGDLADGGHAFEVRATDRAGNTDGSAAAHLWTVDTVAPETAVDSGPADPTRSTSASLEFSSEAGAGFECRLDAGEWAVCSSPQGYDGLADGGHTFEVRATDRAGNTDGSPAGHTWTVDTVAPQTSVDAHPADPSNDDSPSFEFSASEEGSTFECRLGEGEWAGCESPQEYGPLADGAYRFQVRATDRAGNTDPLASGFSWTVDTVAPETAVDSGPADPTRSTSASFEFSSEDGAGFECRLDAGEWATCSSPQGYEALADGEHTFEVRATDLAGNTDDSPATHTWTVDTVAPETAVDSGPADPTRSTSASLEFSSEDGAGFECRLDAGDWAVCTSPQGYDGLADGEHTFEVRATDRAGNTDGSPAGHTWTVDTVAPQTSVDAHPADPSNDDSPSFEFSSSEEGSTFDCRLGEGEWAGCESPQGYGPLADGAYRFQVRATDRAGNTDALASGFSWTVDTVAPETAVDTGPTDPTRSTSASFEFSSENGAGFECKLDAGEWSACESPQPYGGPLADGEHSFDVRATDAAGNTDGSPAAHAWTVDTAAPETTIGSGPSGPTRNENASFGFSADEQGATFECRLDSGMWVGCSSPQGYTSLPDAAHTFEVRATDLAGNTDATPAVRAWTVDTVAPQTRIGSGPDDPTASTTASFTLSAGEDATFQCRLDTADWASCSSPQEYSALADGPHTFEVRATDSAGNLDTTPAVHAWTVDTVAPETTIDSGPPDPSDERSAEFHFSSGEEGSTFECRLDDGEFGSCTSPQAYSDLADGRYRFEVRATDRAGNVEPEAASFSWTVAGPGPPDPTPPETTITKSPAPLTSSTSVTFEFTSDEPGSTFECALDTDAFASCTTPRDYTGLAAGPHSFQVRAIDAAGNVDETPAGHAWTIDTTAPQTTITEVPPAQSSSTSARFVFTSSETGSSFECALDTDAFASCTTPRDYTGLAAGPHSFQVQAIDAAGNVDGTPAGHAWTIDTTAPETTITEFPPAQSSSTSARFVFSSSETGSAFQCSLDNTAFATCTSPRDYTGLAAGPHSFQVRAIDAAGNVDETPASHSWTVDTTAPQTTITEFPPPQTSSTSARFVFTSNETGSTFQCSLDNAAFATCTSPRDYTGLPAGSRTFRVRAVDAAGNIDGTPASHTWTIDTTAPQTTITQSPPAQSPSTSARFEFSSSETGSTFECSLDNAAFATCTTPRDYTGLAATSHTFRVQAIDPAGNVDGTPASHTWTISPALACATPATALSAADAWIDQNSSTSNKGTDSILKVQSKANDNFRALIRFGLPPVPQGCVIESATLRLFAASTRTGRTLHALRLVGAWSENLVTWANQPPTAGSAAATASGFGYREWNVTSQVQAIVTEGVNHGFMIRDAVEGQDAEQQFHSREKGETPPQLVIRFAPAGP